MSLSIRDAVASDLEVIVAYNEKLAFETEDKVLDHEILTKGVTRALAEPDALRYWVAEIDGKVVGQAAMTREWSDWRFGWVWWFQSVYVAEGHRSQGVFRALHAHIRESALAEGDVIGLRLYVEEENERAKSTYRALGFKEGGYEVFEELWGVPKTK